MMINQKVNKENVYQLYDEIITWFDTHRDKRLVMERPYLDMIKNTIPSGSAILDVGCGTGEPIAKFFIDSAYEVVGIDASEKMIALCKKRFPMARWLVADMRKLKLQQKFNLVIAWHSFFHLPHKDQHHTLKLLVSYLKPQGLLVFTSGTEHSEVCSDNGGYNLYHASLSSAAYKNILRESDCKLILHNVEDPNCGDATVWIARKN
ncbi:MAG: class I SAM-dependent methyltransferase [Pseudomonadota bacterium]